MKRRWIVFALVSFFAAQPSAHARAVVDEILQSRVKAFHQVDVLVRMQGTADLSKATAIKDRIDRIRYVYNQLRSFANESQKPVIEFLKKEKISHRRFYIENLILVQNADAEMIQKISQLPQVSALHWDVQASLSTVNLLPRLFPTPATRGIEAHLTRIKIPDVWQKYQTRGKGIVVGNQDTGFLWKHNALKSQYRGNGGINVNHNYNWLDGFGESAEPIDDHGHGTHTLGSMIGSDGDKNQIGAAPEARWIGCRNMKNGVGTISSYLTCFQFFLAPYPSGGNPLTDGRPDLAPHIINNSWACSEAEGCKGNELYDAVRAHKIAGILNVVAAGNEGPNCGTVAESPSKYVDEVLTVGAYNRYIKDAATFSNRGPSKWNGKIAPDVMAYGDIIRSASNSGINSYEDKSGTSMASPQVAGAIALLWSARPELIGKIDETFAIIRGSAENLTSTQNCAGISGSQIPNSTFGYGMTDILKAVSTK